MYYEEKLINGVLMWRNSPTGDWTQVRIEDMSSRLIDKKHELDQLRTQADALAEVVKHARLVCKEGGHLTNLQKALDALAAYEEGEVTPPEKVSADMDAAVCDCYPNHCEHGDTCWCEPTIELLDNGDKLIIHNKGH